METAIEKFIKIAGNRVIPFGYIKIIKLKNIQKDLGNFRHIVDYNLPVAFESLEIDN